jgi:hypothetical protein
VLEGIDILVLAERHRLYRGLNVARKDVIDVSGALGEAIYS